MQAALLFEGDKVDERIHMTHIDLDAENAGWLWQAPGIPALAAISNDLRASIIRQSVGMRFVEHRELAELLVTEWWQPYENMERGIIPDDAITALTGIGVQPYYLPDLTVIDKFGLADAVVARNPATHANHMRHMAHDRSPPLGYLAERGVNIAVLPAAHTPEDALNSAAYAVQVGTDLWMPFDSPDPHWVRKHFGDNDALRVNSAKVLDPAALSRTQTPSIRSTYDVYHIGNELVYVKYGCRLSDVTTPFFLHITPTDPGSLPPESQAHGYDNRDFNIADYGVPSSGICVRAIGLPHYPIAAIKTGQYNEQGRLWEGEIIPGPP